MKRIPFAMVLVSIILPMLISCTTTQHGLSISNVPNVSELYLRNAGTTDWIRVANIQDIDRSKFSDRVDIRVIDTYGAVYSRFNVPFDDENFTETNRMKYSGKGTKAMEIFMYIVMLAGIITFLALVDWEEKTQNAENAEKVQK